MGFGFRGQAENTGIKKAVMEEEAMEEVTFPILNNELLRRKIEIAAAVSQDKKVIISASGHLSQSDLNPHGLV